MQHQAEVGDFKFHYVLAGNATSLRSKKGKLGDRALTLDEDDVPYEHIVDTTRHGSRIVISLARDFPAAGQLAKHLVDGAVVLDPGRPGARLLERAIERKRARQRRAELVAKGLEHLLRTEQCPSCRAVIDLSGLEPTPYTYCRFCASLFTRDRRLVASGERYRICDGCGMFDRIQGYTEFYFYFLVIVYGYSYGQRFLCDGCAHQLFVKALFLNLLFVLGVPSAIWVKLKSLRDRDPGFAMLARANALARAGRYQEAAADYGILLRRHRDHPAVLMNQAMAHSFGGDERGAASLLERSLGACNHYAPVLRLLR